MLRQPPWRAPPLVRAEAWWDSLLSVGLTPIHRGSDFTRDLLGAYALWPSFSGPYWHSPRFLRWRRWAFFSFAVARRILDGPRVESTQLISRQQRPAEAVSKGWNAASLTRRTGHKRPLPRRHPAWSSCVASAIVADKIRKASLSPSSAVEAPKHAVCEVAAFTGLSWVAAIACR